MRPEPGTIPPIPVNGEPLALELVNTTFIDGGLRGRLIDALTTPGQLDTWISKHHHQFSGALRGLLNGHISTTQALDGFLDLRLALRACLEAITAGAAPATDDVGVVNSFARYGAFRLELAATVPVTVRRQWDVDDPVDIALGEIASDACEQLQADRVAQLRACPAPGCILFFMKSHPRREWCSPACGNRVRVARHARAAKR